MAIRARLPNLHRTQTPQSCQATFGQLCKTHQATKLETMQTALSAHPPISLILGTVHSLFFAKSVANVSPFNMTCHAAFNDYDSGP